MKVLVRLLPGFDSRGFAFPEKVNQSQIYNRTAKQQYVSNSNCAKTNCLIWLIGHAIVGLRHSTATIILSLHISIKMKEKTLRGTDEKLKALLPQDGGKNNIFVN